MLKLPNVTVVIVDNAAVELSQLALRDTLAAAEFAEVHVWTNDEWVDRDYSTPVHFFPFHTKDRDFALATIDNTFLQVTTSHMLLIQWDSWVLNADLWQDSFLSYDYIGAVWPWHKEFKVGNSGFCLCTRALMAKARELHPDESLTDFKICREFRPELESLGFKWAPESVAEQFSFERGPFKPTFGFHGAYNFGRILSKQKLVERIASANAYVQDRREWQELISAARA